MPDHSGYSDHMILKLQSLVERNPHDCEALESLRECLRKQGRHAEAVQAAHRLAKVYMHLGQNALAAFEYENILKANPADTDAKQALEMFQHGDSLVAPAGAPHVPPISSTKPAATAAGSDGRDTLFKLFVGSRRVSAQAFEENWCPTPPPPGKIFQPFILSLAEKGLCSIEDSLEILYKATGAPILPLDQYELDTECARSYTRRLCWAHCVLPLGRLSRCIFVATANPFDIGAMRALHDIHSLRETKVQWVKYLVCPRDLVSMLARVFS